jgi:hypothetical protein
MVMTAGKRSLPVATLPRLMLIGFGTAHHEPATEKFLIVQFVYCAFCFVNGLHLHKREAFRALVVPIAYDFSVLHVSNAGEQLEEIALGGVERQVADVKTGRGDFNSFRLACRSRRLGAISWLRRRFLFVAAVSKKFGNALPECFFLWFRRFLRSPKTFLIASASPPTARAA